jgi:hypothetical protein
MTAFNGPVPDRVAAAAARTAGAGTARLSAAWCTGSPLPESADRRCEGVADLSARRARVSQSLFFTEGATAAFFTEGATAALTGPAADGPGRGDHARQNEMIYDGANAYVRVAGRWTGFFLADPGGPRGPSDPLWPLDALFGARDDAVESGPEAVRGVPAIRCRFTIDLARADAALPAGVSGAAADDGSTVSENRSGTARSSRRGNHQFARPISWNTAGVTTMRTSVASSSTATAMPSPMTRSTRRSPSTNAVNTQIMMAAADVMTRPVLAMPPATASESPSPASRRSLIREIRNTW